MHSVVTIDWKFVVALGGSVVAVIFSKKLDSAAVERVSISMIEAAKDYAIAVKQ